MALALAAAHTGSLRFAAIQMTTTANKQQNIDAARGHIAAAAKNRAQLVCLPEMWSCPYDVSKFREYAVRWESNRRGEDDGEEQREAKRRSGE